MKTIDEIFNQTDNSDLCDNIFCSFADRDNTIHADQYEEAERIITLVWQALGIIQNGGFHYLLEGDFDGDPGYKLTAEAFKAIGAYNAYQAFQEVMKYFPNGLPSDIDKRLELYDRIPESEAKRIDQQFWDDEENVVNQLAEYISTHKDELKQLLSGD